MNVIGEECHDRGGLLRGSVMTVYHETVASAWFILDVPQIFTFRSNVSLLIGSDKSIILILDTFTF